MSRTVQRVLWVIAIIAAAVFIYLHTDAIALFIGYTALAALSVYGPVWGLSKLSDWLGKRDR